MSHLFTAAVLITDLELFEKVVKSFPQLQWNHDRKDFMWYNGNKKVCDHAITYDASQSKIARRHEVGITRVTDSESPAWQMEFDPYDQALSKIIGDHGQTLLNAYSEAYARKFAEANGFTVEKSYDGDHNIILELIDSKQ